MSRNSRELDKVERGFAKLVGPTKARALRKKLEKKIVLAAKQGGGEAQAISDLIRKKQAGWVNVYGTKDAVLVEKGTGCTFLGSNSQKITRKKITPKGTAPVDIIAYRNFAKSTTAENFVPHIYLDKKGNPTVGIGHLIPDAQAAGNLANKYVFTRKGTNVRSTSTDLENDFNAVNSTGSLNFVASAFAKLTQHEMSLAEAEQLALDDIREKVRQLKSRGAFPEFDSYPPIAKFALLDMAFTSGVGKILKDFKVFTPAVRRRDWRVAAKESNRATISADRNTKVRQWFIQAAIVEIFYIHASCTKNLKTKRV